MSGEYGISQWHETMDEIGRIVEDAKELTIAQRIAIAQIHAILSISQELSRIYDPLACFHSTTNALGTPGAAAPGRACLGEPRATRVRTGD